MNRYKYMELLTGGCLGAALAQVWFGNWRIVATLAILALFAIHLRMIKSNVL